jgi:RNA recognition motif-containing protein
VIVIDRRNLLVRIRKIHLLIVITKIHRSNWMSKKLYVGNIAWKTTENDLSEMFGAYGEVVSVKIINDKVTGKSKGFGFVEMENAEEAKEALNEKEVNGRNLRIDFATETKPRFRK